MEIGTILHIQSALMFKVECFYEIKKGATVYHSMFKLFTLVFLGCPSGLLAKRVQSLPESRRCSKMLSHKQVPIEEQH